MRWARLALAAVLDLAALSVFVVRTYPFGDSLAQATERETGADLCGVDTDFRTTTLDLSDLVVANDRIRCATWDGVFPGIVIWSGPAGVPGTRLPVVIFRTSDDRPPGASVARRIYLFVVGGPGDGIRPIRGDSAPARHAC